MRWMAADRYRRDGSETNQAACLRSRDLEENRLVSLQEEAMGNCLNTQPANGDQVTGPVGAGPADGDPCRLNSAIISEFISAQMV